MFFDKLEKKIKGIVIASIGKSSVISRMQLRSTMTIYIKSFQKVFIFDILHLQIYTEEFFSKEVITNTSKYVWRGMIISVLFMIIANRIQSYYPVDREKVK